MCTLRYLLLSPSFFLAGARPPRAIVVVVVMRAAVQVVRSVGFECWRGDFGDGAGDAVGWARR